MTIFIHNYTFIFSIPYRMVACYSFPILLLHQYSRCLHTDAKMFGYHRRISWCSRQRRSSLTILNIFLLLPKDGGPGPDNINVLTALALVTESVSIAQFARIFLLTDGLINRNGLSIQARSRIGSGSRTTGLWAISSNPQVPSGARFFRFFCRQPGFVRYFAFRVINSAFLKELRDFFFVLNYLLDHS